MKRERKIRGKRRGRKETKVNIEEKTRPIPAKGMMVWWKPE